MRSSVKSIGKIADRLTCETKSGSCCRNRCWNYPSRISGEITGNTGQSASTSSTTSSGWCRNNGDRSTCRTTSGARLSVLSSEVTGLACIHHSIPTPGHIEILTLHMMKSGRCSRKKRPRTRNNTDRRGKIGYSSGDGFYSIGIIPGIARESMVSSAH